MAESNQKHMKPSWATGQTVSIREESIIDNGSFLGGQFSCALDSSPLSLSFFLCLPVFMFFVIRIIITVKAATDNISI